MNEDAMIPCTLKHINYINETKKLFNLGADAGFPHYCEIIHKINNMNPKIGDNFYDYECIINELIDEPNKYDDESNESIKSDDDYESSSESDN